MVYLLPASCEISVFLNHQQNRQCRGLIFVFNTPIYLSSNNANAKTKKRIPGIQILVNTFKEIT